MGGFGFRGLRGLEGGSGVGRVTGFGFRMMGVYLASRVDIGASWGIRGGLQGFGLEGLSDLGFQGLGFRVYRFMRAFVKWATDNGESI